jgi:hypothetical protein
VKGKSAWHSNSLTAEIPTDGATIADSGADESTPAVQTISGH